MSNHDFKTSVQKHFQKIMEQLLLNIKVKENWTSTTLRSSGLNEI